MGDSGEERGRPSKRLKTAPDDQHQQHLFIPPPDVTLQSAGNLWATVAAVAVATTTTTSASAPSTRFQTSWPPSQMLEALEPPNATEWYSIAGPGIDSVPISVPISVPTLPIASDQEQMLPMAFGAIPPATSGPAPPASQPEMIDVELPPFETSSAAVATINTPNISQSHDRHSKSRSKVLLSPFRDCINSFGRLTKPRFSRPADGKVNGYIKFNWPERRTTLPRMTSVGVVTECHSHDVGDNGEDDDDNEDHDDDNEDHDDDKDEYEDEGRFIDDENLPCIYSPSVAYQSSQLSPRMYPSPSSGSGSSAALLQFKPQADFAFSMSQQYSPPSSQSSPLSSTLNSQDLVPFRRASGSAPRMLPPLFGMETKMDYTDRRFWDFYIYNWCPGRSVLDKTNLWLQDFAKLQGSRGVLAAIQSLAGIYIYDYQPTDSIRNRTNLRFACAEAYFSRLLRDANKLTEQEASELVTIASILSMQDIVLTERRLKKPKKPRWLVGYQHSEQVLDNTDHGSRFWHKHNVQQSSLRISQSIIVGRALILAQPMMALPSSASFKPEKEASRFGWLLYGTPEDMYEIHGGCGFSKKLLHVISQITYCAARLQQDGESPVVPLTARYLLKELQEMRQWSSESGEWETAKSRPQIIERVRNELEGRVIDSSADMTNVTAEAWRIAAMIYLQCRALRLPRNHRDVLANMGDLAKCINVMPTSGTHFTAQAPLFPVFLLGLLATDPDHMQVAQGWFSLVVSTPVRSSVPPLYEVLKRVWKWIDTDVELTPPVTYQPPESLCDRPSWWERLVARVQSKEQEVLCLT